MDGVHLSQGYEETVYFLSLSPQEFLVFIWSTSKGWKVEPTLEPLTGVESETPGLAIQCPNHLAVAIIPIFLKTW